MKLFIQQTKTFQLPGIDKDVLWDLFVLSFWFALRISETANLCFSNVHIHPATPTLPERISICVVDSKTNNLETPCHMVLLNAISEPEWKEFCPARAFKRLLKRKNPSQQHLFAKTDGKPITTKFLSKSFSTFAKHFRTQHPTMFVPSDKLTFHVFHISAIGFFIRDMGFTLYEAQTVSRHKIGSATTEKIYLAKSRQSFNNSLTAKIQEYVVKHDEPPVATDESDDCFFTQKPSP